MHVDYIQHVGTDLTVVNAARVSFDKESGWDTNTTIDYVEGTNVVSRIQTKESLSARDEKLIRYLAPHGHWTPFSHCFVTLRETVPIFVARQRFKHMVGFSYNEVSRRYVDSAPEFFVPVAWRKRAENKKQGSSDEVFYDKEHFYWTGKYKRFIEAAEELYDEMLKGGVCPEQARMVLPQSMYTSYYVSGSLAAWARLYKQRVDPHAQMEIQDLAHMVGETIAPLFPVSWEALTA